MPWYDDEYEPQEKRKPNINFDQFKGKIKLPNISAIIVILILAWLASGIYIVQPQEVGVVKRFGKFVRITYPGPHWHIPYPIEEVLKPKVTKVWRLEIGFRTIPETNPPRYITVPQESLMLTGDENIIRVEFIVQYKIKDPVAYLFNVKNPRITIFKAAEASMREIIGKNDIDTALTTGKAKIQQECRLLLQSIVDKYKLGVKILTVQMQDVHPPKEVIEAFKDVASAKEDKERLINEAEAYRNDIIPKAKGEAAKIINQALAYKQAVINKAIGDTKRFELILAKYKQEKDITKKRIYLDIMEKILKDSEKIVISNKSSMKLLPLINFGEKNVEGKVK